MAEKKPAPPKGGVFVFVVNIDRGLEIGGVHLPLETDGVRTEFEAEETPDLRELVEKGYLIRKSKSEIKPVEPASAGEEKE